MSDALPLDGAETSAAPTPRPHDAAPTAADLEAAKNAALECGACAAGPVGFLEYAGVDGFFKRTSAALGGEEKIDRVSRLLVGESLAEFAGMRCVSFHRIAWELAFQVHQAFDHGLQLMNAPGHNPPWNPEVVKAMIRGALGQFEARFDPNLLSELREKILFEYDRALNRLAHLPRASDALADGGANRERDQSDMLPQMLSAPDLARTLKANPDRVGKILERYRKQHTDCFREVEGARRNEAQLLYRVADVLPHLKQVLAKGRK
jgi:hypothetical protein